MIICFSNHFGPKRNTFIFAYQIDFVVLRSLIFTFEAVSNCLEIVDNYLSLSQDFLSFVHNFPINSVKGIRNMLDHLCYLNLILLNLGKRPSRQIYILRGDTQSKRIKLLRHERHLFIDLLKLCIYLFCDF